MYKRLWKGIYNYLQARKTYRTTLKSISKQNLDI